MDMKYEIFFDGNQTLKLKKDINYFENFHTIANDSGNRPAFIGYLHAVVHNLFL